MKRKWYILAAALMTAVMTISGVAPALADDGAGEAVEARPVHARLAIRAPKAARVGEEVTIGVFDRRAEEPVQGAGVWAVTREAAGALKSDIAELREDTGVAAHDYESLANLHGTFLGRTNEEGQVTHAFEDAGRYLLVAWKPGYLPGFRGIFIGTPPSRLAIRAPKVARVGEEVTIGVFDRRAEEPVEGAGVWAMTREAAGALKSDIAELREDTSVPATDHDYASLAGLHGTFLGRTNEEGQVTHAFEDAGRYLLLAWKPGYLPGLGHISIRSMPTMLGIKAPRVADAGDEVTMRVFERRSGDAVSGAGVWLVPRGNAAVLKEALAHLRQQGNTAAAAPDYAAVLEGRGAFLGRTGAGGELTHTFAEAGRYWLVAVKGGHIPGIAPINIRGERPDAERRGAGLSGRPQPQRERPGRANGLD